MCIFLRDRQLGFSESMSVSVNRREGLDYFHKMGRRKGGGLIESSRCRPEPWNTRKAGGSTRVCPVKGGGLRSMLDNGTAEKDKVSGSWYHRLAFVCREDW
jgi:hypothetical protein